MPSTTSSRENRINLVVNLADVTAIDSAGIGVLVGRFLSVRRRGGDMKLANLTARSHRVMTITQLLDVFDCFDSVDEAVAGFAVASLISSDDSRPKIYRRARRSGEIFFQKRFPPDLLALL